MRVSSNVCLLALAALIVLLATCYVSVDSAPTFRKPRRLSELVGGIKRRFSKDSSPSSSGSLSSTDSSPSRASSADASTSDKKTKRSRFSLFSKLFSRVHKKGSPDENLQLIHDLNLLLPTLSKILSKFETTAKAARNVEDLSEIRTLKADTTSLIAKVTALEKKAQKGRRAIKPEEIANVLMIAASLDERIHQLKPIVEKKGDRELVEQIDELDELGDQIEEAAEDLKVNAEDKQANAEVGKDVRQVERKLESIENDLKDIELSDSEGGAYVDSVDDLIQDAARASEQADKIENDAEQGKQVSSAEVESVENKTEELAEQIEELQHKAENEGNKELAEKLESVAARAEHAAEAADAAGDIAETREDADLDAEQAQKVEANFEMLSEQLEQLGVNSRAEGDLEAVRVLDELADEAKEIADKADKLEDEARTGSEISESEEAQLKAQGDALIEKVNNLLETPDQAADIPEVNHSEADSDNYFVDSNNLNHAIEEDAQQALIVNSEDESHENAAIEAIGDKAEAMEVELDSLRQQVEASGDQQTSEKLEELVELADKLADAAEKHQSGVDVTEHDAEKIEARAELLQDEIEDLKEELAHEGVHEVAAKLENLEDKAESAEQAAEQVVAEN